MSSQFAKNLERRKEGGEVKREEREQSITRGSLF